MLSEQVLKERYITESIIELLKFEKTKLAKKVQKSLYDLYNTDSITIINLGDIFYFETRGGATIPKYVRKYLIDFLEKIGLQYLYKNIEIKTKQIFERI